MAERSETTRGFVIYDQLTDTHGNDVRVQESSSAEGPRVWIFATRGGFPQEGASPHLDVEQAKRIRDALDAFIHEQEGGGASAAPSTTSTGRSKP